MRRVLVPAFALLLAWVAAGCHNPENDVVGTWRNETKLTPAEQKAAGTLGNDLLASTTIRFTADHRYHFAMGGMLDDKGTWKLSGNTLTTHTETMNGMTVDQFRTRLLNSRMAKAKPDMMKRMVADLDRDDTYKLSADGKQLDSVTEHSAGTTEAHFRKES